MHLVVLGAFGHKKESAMTDNTVLMHLVVLGAF